MPCPAWLHIVCPSGLTFLRPESLASALLAADMPSHSALDDRSGLHLPLESAVSMFGPSDEGPTVRPSLQTEACITGPISDHLTGLSKDRLHTMEKFLMLKTVDVSRRHLFNWQ